MIQGAVQVDELVELIGVIHVSTALNIYDEDECQAQGDEPGMATERKEALRRYLTAHWSAPIILVGEAPGKSGARWSGIPFTSQRQLTGSGPTEASATIVHRVLANLGVENEVLLWNASFLFPALNRNPFKPEIAACARVLELICVGRTTIAVGRQAELATGVEPIRHPSHGGAAQFAEGLRIATERTAKAGPELEMSRGPTGASSGSDELIGRIDRAALTAVPRRRSGKAPVDGLSGR